jgi:hypothetical protein
MALLERANLSSKAAAAFPTNSFLILDDDEYLPLAMAATPRCSAPSSISTENIMFFMGHETGRYEKRVVATTRGVE